YIAIDKVYQGQGFGSEMFRLMVKYFHENNIADSLIWEVEPSESDDPNHVTNRRIRFYEKLGAKIIALSEVYSMPDFGTGDGGQVPLRLMQMPLSHQPDKAAVNSIITSIYDTAYPDYAELKNNILDKLAK